MWAVTSLPHAPLNHILWCLPHLYPQTDTTSLVWQTWATLDGLTHATAWSMGHFRDAMWPSCKHTHPTLSHWETESRLLAPPTPSPRWTTIYKDYHDQDLCKEQHLKDNHLPASLPSLQGQPSIIYSRTLSLSRLHSIYHVFYQFECHNHPSKNADPQYPGWISSPGPRAGILHPGRRPEHEAYDTVLPHGRCGRVLCAEQVSDKCLFACMPACLKIKHILYCFSYPCHQ